MSSTPTVLCPSPSGEGTEVLAVPFIVAGRLVEGVDVVHRSRDMSTPFATPKLDLDALTGSRREPGPAFGVPVSEIIDFLVATGERLNLETNPLLQDALDRMVQVHPLGRRILTRLYQDFGILFDRASLEFQLENELGGADVVDTWKVVKHPAPSVDLSAEGDDRVPSRSSAVRAFPARMVHVLAGNGPGCAPLSIVRGALTKGVHVLKMASNDLFTATAVLRTMAEIDPEHPTLRSFSAVYWRGGDETIESVLYRSQFFDKLAAWGGEAAMRSAARYIAPGFEILPFDPKVSVSFIGREAFASEEALAEAAGLAAVDATLLNQDGCVCSRYQFVEGSLDDADRYCELLAPQLGIDRPLSSGTHPPTPAEIRESVDVLRHLEPAYRVWGGYDGQGLVVRSEDPVDFHPDAKTVNVVPVASLADAVRFVTTATQTVGVYPSSRKAALRDGVACAGAQRVVPLGSAGEATFGLPHDAMFPLHRFVRWVADEHLGG